ncbi:hypothetical protein K469DRAFT_743214 [Zopfia rhizophila CBS 207.26]|uniref:DUF6536 domain-containing protein n=1 Tax=Zopfia rhizophila CBS 207.26 TaxID=1314779 RepID=A0A6A6DB54_9PEZI|nr:hypothetical protein K469DRAFT_743214 [Zopfia rhizophila CBS 207.26]
MSNLKNPWNITAGWIKKIGTSEIQQQQWRDADPTELRSLNPSPYFRVQGPEDPSYRPREVTYGNMTFVDITDAKSEPRPEKRYTLGWRFGAINCAISATIVFLINFIVTIWGSVHKNANPGIMLEGDCEQVRRMNTGLHFLINLLSTILLSSSNYCMQCLSAPTRKEVDKAHAEGTWLDIGVPSIRNLRYISKQRVILWLVLGLSSLPLHLFYNSAVFSSIASNDYWAFSVSESFVNNPECLNCGIVNTTTGLEETIRFLHQGARTGIIDRLENSDCINQYAQMIQSKRRNVLLVSKDSNMPSANNHTSFRGSNVYSYAYFQADEATDTIYALDIYRWMCKDYDREKKCGNEIPKIKKNPQAWTVNTYPVEYCLSERAPPVCKLQFSATIAILITILNSVKAVIMFYTAFGVKESPLMTMGDAVASFMENGDPATRNMCLLTIEDAKKHKGYFPAGPKEWDSKAYRWKDVTSKTRRITTFTMFTLALILVSFLLGLGLHALPDGKSLPALARLGYGAVDPRAIIDWPIRDTVSNVLLANLAQPILSFLYFSYNGLFTCMLLGYEWSQYAHRRKGLRVSRAPSGEQRSTYFLQLPYRFALPLMVLSGVLHWLVSQSIFLVSIDLYDFQGSYRGHKKEGIRK